jgi:PKD repeat protein
MRYVTTVIMAVLVVGLLSCEKKAQDKEPTANFSVSPETGPFTTVFTFDASETYNEGVSTESIKIRWDFDGDGIFETEYSKSKVKNYKYEEAGYYDVRMEAQNSLGWTDSEIYIIYVFPESLHPVYGMCEIPDSCSKNTIVHFNAGSSFDPYTPIEELMFRWDWEGDSIWDTPFCSDTIIYHKFTCPGNYRVMMEVKNEVHLTDSTGQNISIFEF